MSFAAFSSLDISSEEYDDVASMSNSELRRKYNPSASKKSSKYLKTNKQRNGRFKDSTSTATIDESAKGRKLNRKTTETLQFSAQGDATTTSKKSSLRRRKKQQQASKKSAHSTGAASSGSSSKASNPSKEYMVEQFRKLTPQKLKDMIQRNTESPAQFCEEFSKRFASLHFQPRAKKPSEPLKYFTVNQDLLREWGDSLTPKEATSCCFILLNRLFTVQGTLNGGTGNVAQLVLLQILVQQQPQSFLQACSDVLPQKFSSFSSKSIRNLSWLISQFDEQPGFQVQLFLEAFVLHPEKKNVSSTPNTSVSILSHNSKKEICALLDDIMDDVKNAQQARNSASPVVVPIHENELIALLKFKHNHFMDLELADSFTQLIQFVTDQVLDAKETNHAHYFHLLFHMLKSTLKGTADDQIQQKRTDLLHCLNRFYEAEPSTCSNQWLANETKTKAQRDTSLLLINYLRTKKPSITRNAKHHLKSIIQKLEIDEEELHQPTQNTASVLSSMFSVVIFSFILLCVVLFALSFVCKEMDPNATTTSAVSVPARMFLQFLNLLGVEESTVQEKVCSRLPF